MQIYNQTGFPHEFTMAMDKQGHEYVLLVVKGVMEIRDHPLFLLPLVERRKLLDKLFAGTGAAPPVWLVTGQLSHKNQQVFQALMMAEEGNLVRALRHVQIERWHISKKYRLGAITLGPELSVDSATYLDKPWITANPRRSGPRAGHVYGACVGSAP